MCNYLCNFIKTGDPNGDDHDGVPMPAWSPAAGGGAINAMWFRDDGPACIADAPDPMTAVVTEVFLESQP